jgi:hypothetical protein
MNIVYAFLLGVGISGATTSVIWNKKCTQYEIAIQDYNKDLGYKPLIIK